MRCTVNLNLENIRWLPLALLLGNFAVFVIPSRVIAPLAAQPPPQFTPSEVQRVFVPFLINDEERGQILVFLPPDQPIQFQSAPILQQTAEILIEDIQQKLRAAVSSEGSLTLEAFTKNGLGAVFDQRKLELQIQIPPDKRRKNPIILGGDGVPPEAANALLPSDLSGWLNVRAINNLFWSEKDSSSFGSNAIAINLDGALNFKGWVLEHNLTFFSDEPNPWQRDYTRLVRDDLRQQIRYTIGDFSLSGRGFRLGGEFLGIAMAKNFSLQPYQRTVPSGEYEFFLENPSTVEIYVNGFLTQVLQLPAGRQDLRNLNLNTGVNDIRLVITDDLGRERILDFSIPFDFNLLATGVNEFAFALGYTSDPTDDGRITYDFERPTLSLFYRTGVSNHLTLGSYFQGDPKEQLIGVEGNWATTLGNFGLETAVSHSTELSSDYAIKLGYRYRDEGDSSSDAREFNLSVEYKGENFVIPGVFDFSEEEDDDFDDFANDFAYEISASYRQRLFEDLNLSLGANYRLGGREDERYSGNIFLGLSKSLWSDFQANLLIQKQFNVDDKSDFGLGLSFTWSPSRTRHRVTGSTDTITETSQLSWFTNSPYLVNGTTSSVIFQNDPTRNNLNTTLEYSHYRGKIAFAHNLGQEFSGDRRQENTSQLRLESALVFADGYFGFTRPVRDSFVLVVPHPTLRDQVIDLNPFLAGFEGRIDRFGAGVIPDLSSYRVAKIRVDAPNLPLGYDLGPPSYDVLPTYKSGTLIRIGSDATVLIRGVLTNAQGEPVMLKVVEAVSLDDPSWQPVTFFTNQAGKFAAEGFKPGRYEARILGEDQATVRFDIPDNQAGIYDVETLQIAQ